MKGEKCATCGNPADKYSSGTPECWKCWNWRKLDRPAAYYWVKAIDNLFTDGFSAAPDFHDLKTWASWELSDSVERALYTLIALRHAYQHMLDNPHPWKQQDEANT